MAGFNITTQCYIRRDSDVLFIHKGRNDMNTGKYLGIGGHLEEGEAPAECIVREIFEETGIKETELSKLRMRAVITFVNSVYEDEYIILYEAEYTGNEDPALRSCSEGELKWVDRRDIYDLPIWEGDKYIFDKFFESTDFFELKLIYDKDVLKEVRNF
ncbi:MAG: NUDIX domain-containing protein [Saccharofermentans sp.]|nr:NUDIX domain-containing protein [Saccharofermentans sp.]